MLVRRLLVRRLLGRRLLVRRSLVRRLLVRRLLVRRLLGQPRVRLVLPGLRQAALELREPLELLLPVTVPRLVLQELLLVWWVHRPELRALELARQQA